MNAPAEPSFEAQNRLISNSLSENTTQASRENEGAAGIGRLDTALEKPFFETPLDPVLAKEVSSQHKSLMSRHELQNQKQGLAFPIEFNADG